MSVKVVDRGYEALVRRVYGLQSPVIKVGIFEDEGGERHADGSMTVLELAIVHEFGTDTVPERSFIRAWFDENQEKAREAVRVMLSAVVEGKYSKEQALNLLAQRFVGEIQKRIASNIPPPLEAATMARKGSGVALIDTGQLRSSISYKVEG